MSNSSCKFCADILTYSSKVYQVTYEWVTNNCRFAWPIYA